MRNGNRGFTIYEIVITLVVSSISVSIGMENSTAADVPSVELYLIPSGHAGPDLNSFLGSVTIDFVRGQARRGFVLHPTRHVAGGQHA
jgi:prepilin-type N-terminal cleavage/methylation domain-containing protein